MNQFGNRPIWVQSVLGTHFTVFNGTTTIVAEEESIPIGSGGTFIKGTAEGTGFRQFMLLSFTMKVHDASNTTEGGPIDQALNVLFYHDSTFDSDVLGTDSVIGVIQIGQTDWELATDTNPGTVGVNYFSDHDINMPLIDSEVHTTIGFPRLHVQLQAVSDGGTPIVALDEIVLQFCLLPL